MILTARLRRWYPWLRQEPRSAPSPMQLPCYSGAQDAVVGAPASSWLTTAVSLMASAFQTQLAVVEYLVLLPYSSPVLPMKTDDQHQTLARSLQPHALVQALQFLLSPLSYLLRFSICPPLTLSMSMFESVDQVHCLLQLSSSCFSGILQSSYLNCSIPMDFGCSTFDLNFSCSCGLCFIESFADLLSGLERPSYWFEWESFHAFDHLLRHCFQVGRSRRLLLRSLELLVLMTSRFANNSANCPRS